MDLRAQRHVTLAVAMAAASAVAAPAPDDAAAPWPALVQSALDALENAGLRASREGLEARLLRAVLEAADSQGEVVHVSEEAATRARCEGRVWGLGFELALSNHQTIVSAVWPGGPAAGVLRPGDVLDRLGDRYVTGIPLATQQQWIANSTGAVAVTVMRPPRREPLSWSLTSAWVRPPAVALSETLPGGIRLLRLRGVWEGAAAAVATAWGAPATGRHAGVVLDLREAGGADLAEAAKIAGAVWPKDAVIFSLEPMGTAGVARTYRGGRISPPAQPLMALIGPRTRSAAEALALALRRGEGGVLLIGQATAGDPHIRDLIGVNDAWRFLVATRTLKVGEERITGPLPPDIEVLKDAPAAPENRSLEWALNPRRGPSEAEAMDEALRRRIRGDAALQRAVDLLIALRAVGAGALPK